MNDKPAKTIIRVRLTKPVREAGFLLGALCGLGVGMTLLGAIQVHLCHAQHPKATWLACLRPMVRD